MSKKSFPPSRPAGPPCPEPQPGFQNQLIDLAPVGHFVLAHDATIRRANLNAARLLGMEKPQLEGMLFTHFVMRGDLPAWNAFFTQVFAGPEVQACEVTLCKIGERRSTASFTGSRFFSETSQHVIRIEAAVDESGQFCNAVAIDITERKHAEARLDAERELLRICHFASSTADLVRELIIFFKQLTGCPAIGIRLHQGEDYPYYETVGFSQSFIETENHLCAVDAQGNVLYDSSQRPLLECMCGNVLCERTDPGQPFFTQHGSFWSSNTTRLLASTTDADRQTHTRNRCNRDGYESVALVPLRSRGTTYGLVQFSDQRRGSFTIERIELLEHLVDYVALALANLEAAEAMRKSEEKYRLLVENAGEAIYVIQDHVFQFLNPKTEEISGYSTQELMAQSFLMVAHPEDRAEILQQHNRRMQGDLIPSSTFRIVRKSGEMRWTELKAATIQWKGRPATLNFLTDITERKHMQDSLQASVAEKDILLREVHHRVKNNLAAILGLLEMERHTSNTLAVNGLLLDLTNRITAMATIHEKLYQSENLARIDFQDYLKVFVSHLQASYPPPGPLVSRVEADGIKLGLDEAVPCGLIVNELVTNALKYAFPDGKPGVPGAAVNEIVIRLSIVGATCILSVSDNGVGLRPDLDWKTTPSMGLRLVRMLGEHQLDGKIELDRSSGTRFTLTFDLRHRI